MLSDESREAVKTVAVMAAIIHNGKMQSELFQDRELTESSHKYGPDCNCVEEARLMFNETISVLSGETRK